MTNKIALETRWMLKYYQIMYPNHEYTLITIAILKKIHHNIKSKFP
jgi:hypothetical protein